MDCHGRIVSLATQVHLSNFLVHIGYNGARKANSLYVQMQYAGKSYRTDNRLLSTFCSTGCRQLSLTNAMCHNI